MSVRAERRTRGFTLLECLIALLVVGLVLGGSLYQVSRYADERAGLAERLGARTVAWNRLMEQYQLVQGWVQPVQGPAASVGSTENFAREWFWGIEATSTLAQDFYRYEVRVYDSATAQQADQRAAVLAAYLIAD